MYSTHRERGRPDAEAPHPVPSVLREATFHGRPRRDQTSRRKRSTIRSEEACQRCGNARRARQKIVQPIIKACELCIELYCKAAKPEAKDEDYINATDEQLMWWSTYGSPEQKAKVTATASLRASRSAVKVT